jgi:hypothetical protein
MISEFDAVVGKLGKGEASEKAAATVMEEIGGNAGMKHT